MRRAVCPGSFDPIHNGHLEVIARAASLFDEVIVAVSTNYAKKYRFPLEERIEMAKETLASLRGIVVEPVGEGLLAEYCRQRGVSAIVKGLRSSSDFDYELPMATMNRQLSGVETVFLPAEAHYLHLSSTLIKEVFTLGGNVSEFVPRSVLKRLLAGGSASGQSPRG
ncbi:pantetheine-phosphate adenylyltransferase [Arthrobacter sp. ISL-28]|uniref:pantetheine-phosphate adenylyltransferase n=1 Tax=Arthrobacter sp. ISL-28 TaxID=2819108 RepID=UPI001BE8E0B0|nr:pantetheine-phosphate adenylyltransferase [Arthrobacter sp. ISL-28]MBT2521201.1 pantetheine-phosphate adenylyltransferase [Arthrobacter sp. ISL-28]